MIMEENTQLPAEVVERILKARDALVVGDRDEAYHQLYAIASPKFDKYSPWEEMEKQVGHVRLNEQDIINSKEVTAYATKLHQSNVKFNPALESEGGKLYRQYCEEKGIDYSITAGANFCLGYMAVKPNPGAVWVKAHGGMASGIYSMKLVSGDNVEMRGTGMVNHHGVIQLITFLNKSTMGIDDLPKNYEGVYYLDESATGRGEDACDFAEWMRLNCKSSQNGWVDALGKWDTTKGWYELFKQQKEK